MIRFELDCGLALRENDDAREVLTRRASIRPAERRRPMS